MASVIGFRFTSLTIMTSASVWPIWTKSRGRLGAGPFPVSRNRSEAALFPWRSRIRIKSAYAYRRHLSAFWRVDPVIGGLVALEEEWNAPSLRRPSGDPVLIQIFPAVLAVSLAMPGPGHGRSMRVSLAESVLLPIGPKEENLP